MATGRTKPRWTRVYLNGYNYSGITRSVEPLTIAFDEVETTTMGDTVKTYLPDMPSVNIGTMNLVFYGEGVNIFDGYIAGENNYPDTVMIAFGIRAEPAQGDPVFLFKGIPLSAQANNDGGAATVTRTYSGWDPSSIINYVKPWGTLVHALSAVTAANTAIGYDDGAGASTTRGGWMMYQVIAGDTGTITLKVQDAAVNTNPSFADLTGATSGVINATAGTKGIVQLGVTATVRQFLRWQVVLGTAATCTFVLGFVRG